MFYVLDKKNKVIEVEGSTEWASFQEKRDRRRVAEDWVGPYRVSTVFLGIDHGDHPTIPIVFETMVFDSTDETECYSYATWKEAAEGHRETVNRLTKGLKNDSEET